jgi:hypothetical protein
VQIDGIAGCNNRPALRQNARLREKSLTSLEAQPLNAANSLTAEEGHPCSSKASSPTFARHEGSAGHAHAAPSSSRTKHSECS